MTSIYPSLGASAGLCILTLGGLVALLRSDLIRPRGVVALIYYCAFLVSPLMWMLSLVPPLNDPDTPEIMGVGGGDFGNTYELNMMAVWVWAALGCICIFPMLWRDFRCPENARLARWIINKDTEIPSGATALLVGLACILFVLYFMGSGWDSLWFVRRHRFEYVQGVGFISHRVLGVLLIMCGGIGAFLVALNRRVAGAAICAICAIPFMCTASRAAPVILAGLVLALVYSIKKTRLKVLAAIAGFMLVFLFYAVVISFRNMSMLGLQPFGSTLWSIVSGSGSSTRDSLVIFLQNTSNGFPIFTESILRTGDAGLWESLPIQYKILSHSPTPSFIDGFNANWLQYTPFLNFYTPYNAISELWAVSPLWLFVFFLLHAILFRCLLRLAGGMNNFSEIARYSVAMVCAATMFQALQYPLRTFVKYTSVGVVLLLVSGVALRVYLSSRRKAR